MTTSHRLKAMIAQLDELVANDEALCLGLITDARTALIAAYEGNLHEEQEAARDAAEERRTMRAENGHPQ